MSGVHMMADYQGHSAMTGKPRLKPKKMPKMAKGKSKKLGGIIGKRARAEGAAPGGPNYHGK